MPSAIQAWNGKIVWIIGASFGIGRCLAQALDREDAVLILSGRTRDALDTLRASLQGPHHAIIPLDVTIEGNLAQAFQDALTRFPRIDVIIYGAGAYQHGGLFNQTPESLRTTFETNLLAPVHLLSQVGPTLIRQGGCQLVFLGSVAGYSGLPQGNAYAPSKAGLLNFCEGMTLELKGTGLEIRIVNPGFVATRLTAQNAFSMPLMISPEKAAESILQGLRTTAFQIDFPKGFSWILRALRVVPYRVYFALVGAILKKLPPSQP